LIKKDLGIPPHEEYADISEKKNGKAILRKLFRKISIEAAKEYHPDKTSSEPKEVQKVYEAAFQFCTQIAAEINKYL